MDLIGKKIREVSYYDVNRLEHPMFFRDFDNFDLGINLEFTDGTNWSVGWKDDDYPQEGMEKYLPHQNYDSFLERSATQQWNKVIGSAIVSAKVELVAEERRIFGRSDFEFKNGESVSVIIGLELNLDGTLPLPLRYEGNGDFYVFHTREIPAYESVKIIYPIFDEDEAIEGKYDKNQNGYINHGKISAFDDAPTKRMRGEVVLGFILLLVLLTICLNRLYG